jgi:hypothetical protein
MGRFGAEDAASPRESARSSWSWRGHGKPVPAMARLRSQPYLAAALVALAACNKTPAEPEASANAPGHDGGIPQPPLPAVPPLHWDAPGAWVKLDVPSYGDKKAAYRIEAGPGADDAGVTVFFHGTGSKGDPAASFKEWFASFDGDVGASAAREHLHAGDLAVDTVEASGTYKIGLTPTPRGRKESPMQMVKKNWRLYGAVVKTPDRGNWFFELVGPDEMVQRARSAFRAMIESAR